MNKAAFSSNVRLGEIAAVGQSSETLLPLSSHRGTRLLQRLATVCLLPAGQLAIGFGRSPYVGMPVLKVGGRGTCWQHELHSSGPVCAGFPPSLSLPEVLQDGLLAVQPQSGTC